MRQQQLQSLQLHRHPARLHLPLPGQVLLADTCLGRQPLARTLPVHLLHARLLLVRQPLARLLLVHPLLVCLLCPLRALS